MDLLAFFNEHVLSIMSMASFDALFVHSFLLLI
jgi:hypothetical protein